MLFTVTRANVRRDFRRIYECTGHINAGYMIGTSYRQIQEILQIPIRYDQGKNRSDLIGSCLTDTMSNFLSRSNMILSELNQNSKKVNLQNILKSMDLHAEVGLKM